ncbi:MAG: hypothetical protein HRT83_00760 [Hyphomicrobiaceae bacterium]|nr:hypothetical protein [Hyphomicrobiaceae bacterium]
MNYYRLQNKSQSTIELSQTELADKNRLQDVRRYEVELKKLRFLQDYNKNQPATEGIQLISNSFWIIQKYYM